MTSKERLLLTFRGELPDHVPVSPDISVMVPDRLTGRPFDEIHLDGREHHGWTSATHTEAYINAVKYFDMDGFYMYGGLEQLAPADRPVFTEQHIKVPQGTLVERRCHTALGDLTETELYYSDAPSWRQEKPLKDLAVDFAKLKLHMGEEDWQWADSFIDYDRLSDLGVYCGMTPVFQDWYFHNRQGGFEACFTDFMEQPALVDEIYEFWQRWALASVSAMVAAKPDVIMLGGSSASLSVSSPDIFRRYELPFIQQAAQICNAAGVVSHLHVCGRSAQLVEIVAEETDVQVMEPVEEPPGGNVDMAVIKKKYGHKLTFKGNISTTQTMLLGSVREVEEKCKRLIDVAAAGGRFVLSTGDQCGRDTPDENLFKMVEVAKTFGQYR
ncbi:hypothetical protein JXA02_13720 [candidate division KSB1 bacterium]|nr:hypothetical protein [candidate division KSB1 bacterium]